MKPHSLNTAWCSLCRSCGLAWAMVLRAPAARRHGRSLRHVAATIGIVITCSGRLRRRSDTVVPLGDLLNDDDDRRADAVVGRAVLMIAVAPSSLWLLIGMTLTGLLAVVTQVLVAYAATLAIPAQRGRVVGVVTSGIVVGILLARTVAGAMADLAGWRAIYLLSAGLTLLMALLLFRVLPKDENPQPTTTYSALIVSVFSLFREERYCVSEQEACYLRQSHGAVDAMVLSR